MGVVSSAGVSWRVRVSCAVLDVRLKSLEWADWLSCRSAKRAARSHARNSERGAEARRALRSVSEQLPSTAGRT